MSKVIDLRKTVFELSEEYPEFIEIMREIGFSEITGKAMLHSVGKIMTPLRGARMKNISLDKIVNAFSEKGFEVIGLEKEKSSEKSANISEKSDDSAFSAAKIAASGNTVNRTELIKSYLKRLGEGEALEVVQEDFVRNFGDVEASEIMYAEQELMKEGTPLEEVQQLCDVHSALFHGSTREEKIMNAEKAVNEAVIRKNAADHAGIRENAANNMKSAAAPERVKGIPYIH